MTYLLLGLGVLVAVGTIVWLYWRYLSRVTAAPCPATLAWMLEMDPPGRTHGQKNIAALLDLQPGMRVADVGCGPGRLTLPLAKAVGPTGEVVALDLQQAMLDRMLRRIGAAGLSNVRPLHAAAGAGALPPAYFDRVLLTSVLGEIPDRQRALSEIRTALRPGGFLLVIENLGDPHYQFESKVRALAAETDLRPGEKTRGWLTYSIRLHND